MKRWLPIFCWAFFALRAEVFDIYKEIADIRHPTITELQKIQHVLLNSPRPELKNLADKELISREFKFIGESTDEMPQYFHLAVNTDEEERENCIIIYASFNHKYSHGAKRLFSWIAQSDFKGHVHCRIGGWPDLEGGSIALAHVPFAFKPCFFKEMQKMQYKRVLYLDASILPSVSLNDFFDIIREKGYYITKNFHDLNLEPSYLKEKGYFITKNDHDLPLAPSYLRKEIAEYFGYTLPDAGKLLSCSACVFGVDFTNEKAAQAIDQWYLAAQDPHAFYSARSDQTALSLVLHRLRLTDWLAGPLSPLFHIDRAFVKNES